MARVLAHLKKRRDALVANMQILSLFISSFINRRWRHVKDQIPQYFTREADSKKLETEDKWIALFVYKQSPNPFFFDPSEFGSTIKNANQYVSNSKFKFIIKFCIDSVFS